MNRTLRKALFMFFMAVFVVATPTLILYAQGYRINWPFEPGKKLVVMTGGFYIETNPKQADVYVNGKLTKQTDFFFGQALLENFLPRQYQIEIKKTGYQSWNKTLGIKEKEVTEIRNINLFPDRTSFGAIEKNANDILASPDRNKIALLGKDENGWNLKLYDTDKGITSKLAEKNDFSAQSAEFSDWEWSGDSKTLDVKTTSNGTTTAYGIAIEKNPPQLIKKTAAATSTDEIASKEIDGSKYYLGKNGSVFGKEDGRDILKTGTAKIAINLEAKYRLWVFGDYYFIAINSELYVKRPSFDSFEKIFDGLTSDLRLSPDAGKIAYSSNSEIWVFFIKNKTGQPGSDEGANLFIARLSDKIANCDWFNSDYLIFTAGNTIRIAETDTRDRVNIAELANFSDIAASDNYQNAQLIWNRGQKSAYIYLNGTLYKSKPVE